MASRKSLIFLIVGFSLAKISRAFERLFLAASLGDNSALAPAPLLYRLLLLLLMLNALSVLLRLGEDSGEKTLS